MADLIDRLAGTDEARPKINLHRFMGAERLYALGEWARAQIATEFDLQGDEATQAAQLADMIDSIYAIDSQMLNSGNLTLTNMPLALTEMGGVVHRRLITSFAHIGQIRLSARVSTVGTATSILYAQYSTNETDWSTLTTNSVSLYTPIGTKATAWEDIPTGAKSGDVYVRLVTSGGNGTTDPIVGNIYLETKNFLDRAIYILRVESVMLCLEDNSDRLYHNADGTVNRAKVYEDILITG